jgi:NitT/TauT family transport system permease protein
MKAASRIRLGVIAALVALLELMVRGGAISRRVLLAPSEMAADLVRLLAEGHYHGDIATTLADVLTAFAIALTAGFATGVAIHALPRLRRALEPLLATYYAVPFFAFYPVFIVILGVGRAPIVIVGVLFGVVAMIVATLNGLDRIPRVLRKTAKLMRMGRIATALRIELPAALPYLFTGIKLAIAYAFIGVIASEFILAAEGIGYRIAYAFNNFDNRTMYALMLFIVGLVTAVNAAFHVAETRLQRRLGR